LVTALPEHKGDEFTPLAADRLNTSPGQEQELALHDVSLQGPQVE